MPENGSKAPDTLRSPESIAEPKIQQAPDPKRNTTRPIADLGPADLAAITSEKVVSATDDDEPTKSKVDTLEGIPRLDDESEDDSDDESRKSDVATLPMVPIMTKDEANGDTNEPPEDEEETPPNRTGETKKGVPRIEEVMEDDSRE